MRRSLTCAAIAAAVVAAPFASAQTIIPTGTFLLNNHPDGNARPPQYGLRLDELVDVTSGHDIFTFDFDHADSEVLLTYNGSSIHIAGHAFGGPDNGTMHDPMSPLTGLYEIEFTYDMGLAQAPGDDDLLVSGVPMGSNTGSITTPLGDVIGLWDKPKNDSFAFRLGDKDNDAGHRGFDGISGWGWLNHGDANVHVAASDWLFTLSPTPVPAPASVAIAGLGGLLVVKRRRA
ncbi:MAG: hypothetical protein AAGK04_13665 [Planctomycetota bacterium]